MLIIGLDTATLTLSAALVDRRGAEDRLLERVVEPPPTKHSALLPGLIEQMLTRAGARPADLAAVVIGLGPGSFTGLRISLATAKAVCYAGGIPLVGVSSLAAMALAAAPDVQEGALLVPCLDARKGEVYCGFYRRRGEEVVREAPDAVMAPPRLIERLAEEPAAQVFGIGRDAYPPLAALAPPGTEVRTPDAWALVRLVGDLPEYSQQSVFALEPHYVRPSEAEWTMKPGKK